MSTVAQILKSKPVNQPVRTLPPQATVREAIELMAEHRIGALLVAEGDRIVGIFTERDYARKIEVRGRSSADTRLAEAESWMRELRVQALVALVADRFGEGE